MYKAGVRFCSCVIFMFSPNCMKKTPMLLDSYVCKKSEITVCDYFIEVISKLLIEEIICFARAILSR